ncbi:MAG: hypothetical protein GWN18_08850 [Thermoplasmata archaeon]|nr:hypothetical protein [Thermoplasmata archaeon]NIS12143.1 hypothetical protein [Thermoplasmata archaeon]NIS20066.1 hypothetical protein [Thermoplasmata archaeon]NIT77280.1 hypothetical protein [Thermoplasmata archaeon]NIU49168.1 hypothetical protein [Thermoplasmata archaeon]
MVKSMKERQQAKKKKRFQLSKERKKQLLAMFLVFLMLGSALVILFTY